MVFNWFSKKMTVDGQVYSCLVTTSTTIITTSTVDNRMRSHTYYNHWLHHDHDQHNQQYLLLYLIFTAYFKNNKKTL